MPECSQQIHVTCHVYVCGLIYMWAYVPEYVSLHYVASVTIYEHASGQGTLKSVCAHTLALVRVCVSQLLQAVVLLCWEGGISSLRMSVWACVCVGLVLLDHHILAWPTLLLLPLMAGCSTSGDTLPPVSFSIYNFASISLWGWIKALQK